MKTKSYYKSIIFCLGMLFFSNSSKAQQIVWSKIFNQLGTNYQTIFFHFIELSDSGFMLVGGTWLNPNNSGNYIIRLDKYGDTLFTKRYSFNSNSINWIEKITDSVFICASGFYYPGESFVNIGCINIIGDTLFHRYYGNSTFDHIGKVIHCYDGGYLLSTDGPTINDIIKLDDKFNVEWDRSSYMSATLVFQDIDSNYIAIGRTGMTIEQYGVVRFDKYGNDISAFSYGNVDSNNTWQKFYPYDLMICADSNYIVTSDGTDWQAMKIDRNTGDTIWTKNYISPSNDVITCITNAGNGTALLAYEHATHGYMLINTNTGDTIWKKNSKPILERILRVSKTSDGGFAMLGENSHNPDIAAFAKLDSLGNTQWTSLLDIENNFSPILFYPNPSSFTISISTSAFQNEPNLVFTLFDVNGRVVIQKDFQQGEETDVSKISDGIYFGEVKSKTKVLRGKIVIQH